MGVLSSTLRINLRDGASGPAKRITGALQSLKRAGSGMAVGNQMAVQSRRMGRAVRRMNSSGGMAGMGATMAAGAFLRNESQVQSSMNMTQAILNSTSDKFQEHRKEVIRLAKAYPTTSNEIAKGASEIAMAGMSLKQVNEVLEATVQGAMASGESIKTVGMGVTDVVMGLGKDLTKGEFLKINNVLVAAATSYSQGYKPFLDGLAKTAPLARMQGMEVERLAGMLGILADAGFKGAKGGTALKTSMINAAAPTKKALDLLNQSGIDLSKFRKRVDTFQLGGKKGAKSLGSFVANQLNLDADSAGIGKMLEPILSDKSAFKDIPKLKKRLSAALRDGLNITDVEGSEKIGKSVNRFIEAGFQSLDFEALMRAMAEKGLDKSELIMKEVFGKRFVAQMAALINSMNKREDGSAGAFDQKMNDIFLPRIEGAVQRFAKILMQGLPGAIKRLGGAFDGLMRAMASSGAIDTVVGALEGLRDIITSLGETSPGLLKAITLIGLSAGLLMPLGLALSGISSLMTVVVAGAGFAKVALMAMSRGATIGIASLAVSGVAAAWGGVTGAIGRAARALTMFNMMALAGGKGFAIKTMLASMGSAFLGLLNPIRLVKAAMAALRLAVIGTGIGAILVGIAAAGTFIYNNWSGIKEMFSGIGEGIREALGPTTMAVFDKIGEVIGKIIGWISDVVGPLDASKEKWRSWGKAIGAAIAFPFKMIGKLLAGIKKIAAFVIPDWVKKLASWAGTGIGKMLGLGGKAESAVSTPPEPVKPAEQAVKAVEAPKIPVAAAAPVGAPAAASVPSVGGDAAAVMNSLSGVEAKASSTLAVVQSTMNQIRSAASLDLTAQGMKIMDTLAAGMRARAGAAVAEMRKTTQQLRDHLPSSPAKTGPLSDLHRLKFGETIARSIKGAPMVSAMRKATAATLAAATLGTVPVNAAIGINTGPAVKVQHGMASAVNSAAPAAPTPNMQAAATRGDIHITVHVAQTNADPGVIADQVGREVRQAVDESYSDGGYI